ncbi:amino acid ABC transporter permease [Mobilitalea sibirica]|uniref:Amino acid ABC transporter permease n=1 Tax=Mobilitalea sibirica TaxID=1462919 RepID=A0A8J7KX98_9FIRM|nr:amino acid ABC transporter permease [Mobilitalea sibirica]MBH1942310.1 amino acid ABC transporter permease [Mobilitalea sibirica]
MKIDNVPLDLLIPNMLSATVYVIQIFILTILLSIPLGFLVALARRSRFKLISVPTRIYQLVFRGTPLMLQLIFFMYGPYYIFGFSFDRFTACIIAFTINYAAYFGEIFRGGIASIPKGQYEAAKVLGYTKLQTFMRIVLPQVIKNVIPATGNELMTLVKDTSLAQVISIPELFRVATNAGSKYFSTVPIVIAAVFYLVMNTVVEFAFKWIEKKFDYYRN